MSRDGVRYRRTRSDSSSTWSHSCTGGIRWLDPVGRSDAASRRRGGNAPPGSWVQVRYAGSSMARSAMESFTRHGQKRWRYAELAMSSGNVSEHTEIAGGSSIALPRCARGWDDHALTVLRTNEAVRQARPSAMTAPRSWSPVSEKRSRNTTFRASTPTHPSPSARISRF